MNVLLVDDDVEILESMRRMTLSMGEGWRVAGLAEDGVDALELLRQQPVDILVADITMTDMDGLELIERAKDFLPELRSLVITCHEDFRYAQESIQLGVEDYLVKYTLTEAKFHQALFRVQQKIEKAQRQQDSLRHLSTEVYKNREHFRESLVRTVLSVPAAGAALIARAPLYGITLPQGAFTVTAVFPFFPAVEKLPADEISLVSYAVMNVAQELIDFAPSFPFRLNGRIYLLIWDTEKDPSWRARLADRLAQLRRHFSENFGAELCMIAGSRRTDFAGLKSMLQRLDGLRDCFFYGESIVLEENSHRIAFVDAPVPQEYPARLEEALFDVPRLREVFRDICGRIERARIVPAQVRLFLDEFVTQLQIVSNYSGRRLPREPVNGGTLRACRLQIEALLDNLQEACFWRQGRRPGRDVQQVAEYVNAHLDTEVSLESAAALVHKNSSYLSRQFKKETGLSFSAFVIHQRVQRATYLLKNTALPVERIAEEVGIANSQYFSTFYKRETGRSPGEIRRQK